jgi:hypothetical protein
VESPSQFIFAFQAEEDEDDTMRGASGHMTLTARDPLPVDDSAAESASPPDPQEFSARMKSPIKRIKSQSVDFIRWVRMVVRFSAFNPFFYCRMNLQHSS